jgi:serine protease Do
MILALGVALPAQAQKALEKASPAMLAAFRDVVARPSESTVRVLCEDKDAALGTVISADGLILTKASELRGKPTCKLRDGRSFPARVLGVEPKTDLALLKIEAKDLKPVEWADSKSAAVGNWLASPGTGDEPVAIGVVSVSVWKPVERDLPRRKVPKDAGYLGVMLGEGEGAPKIGKVTEKSPAAKAGLLEGDLVLKVSGKKVRNPNELIAAIQGFKAGATVTLTVRRDDEELELKATLATRPADLNFDRADFQNNMGSKLSEKRNGFPTILQHDQVIKPTDCGGPLVGLDGKAVGINIARAGRVESYAIPTEVVLSTINELKSGRLALKESLLTSVVDVEKLTKVLAKIRKELSSKEAELRKSDDDLTAERRKQAEEQVAVLRKRLLETEAALEKAKKDAGK